MVIHCIKYAEHGTANEFQDLPSHAQRDIVSMTVFLVTLEYRDWRACFLRINILNCFVLLHIFSDCSEELSHCGEECRPAQ